jgi:predicted RNase H-like nuclease (RuvC/YqgF family)
MKLIGVDPGKTTGWACISIEDKTISLGLFGETKDMTLVELQPQLEEADVIVYEDWLTRPKHLQRDAFDWDPMYAPRVIGSLKTLCRILGKTEVVVQQPSIKPVGYGFANLQYKAGKKGTHWQDALAHATYYVVKSGLAKPVNSAGRK